jgi:hypothetical protein
MMEAVRTSETSVDNHFTRQYNPEDSSEHQVILNWNTTHKTHSVRLMTLINPFGHPVRLLGWVIRLLQGLYLHTTAQYTKTETLAHALSGIHTHDPNVRAVKTNALQTAWSL